jgi:geranylgeranyl diphosphate synthase type I
MTFEAAAPAERRPGPDGIDTPRSLLMVDDRVEQRVMNLLDAEVERWSATDPGLRAPVSALRALVAAGGKRLRPAFCHWAYVGAGGDPTNALAVDAGAALELLHTFALVHDDVMDGSDRRRGRASIHREFIDRHVAESWHGEPRRFGEGVAILAGDLAFVYADMLMIDASPVARRVFDELRVELCIGQFLDLAATATGSRDPVVARRIERYKSGKYTVERPLHLGAALAGRLDELQAPLSAFGLPLGEAFQLRDDILGVFGDPARTGKPVGDDLREGKLTPLIAAAATRARGADARMLARLGESELTDADIAALQGVLIDTGARAEIEATIERLVAEALDALTCLPVTRDAVYALEQLGLFAAWRDR